jgi:hypothetical protein
MHTPAKPILRHALVRSVGVWLVLPAILGAQRLPAGWRASSTAEPGTRLYEAINVPPGEQLTVRESAATLTSGVALTRWLSDRSRAETPPAGRWVTEPSVNTQSPTLATASREYSSDAGRRGAVVWFGVSSDAQQVRVYRIVASSRDVLQSAAGRSAQQLVLGLVQRDVAASPQRAPASTVSDAGPVPTQRGIRPGGAIVPGRYVGNMVTSEGKVIRHYDLALFANGEYAYASGEDGSDTVGTYQYAAATGRLDVTDKLTNNQWRPDEDFCLFGRDGRGEPVIYAEDYYGVGTFKVLLRRVGDVTREPPTVVAAKEAAATAERERYKYVTAPGAGLRSADIEAMYYAWEQQYTIGGMQMDEEVYLLLRDGTVRRGVPVAPADLDVPRSKRMEPDEWGRWRRAGGRYEFAFARGSNTFSRKQGYVLESAARVPLTGRYEGASSYAIPGGAAAWSSSGVTFSADGRFSRDRSGGAGGTSGVGETAVTAVTTYDDEGSSASVTSGVAGGGSSRRTPDAGNRRGTYRVDGYTIILSYENGRVERAPFAIQKDDGGRVSGVWMMSTLLSPPRKR